MQFYNRRSQIEAKLILRRILRHSHFVQRAKKICLLLAIVSIISLILFPIVYPQQKHVPIPNSENSTQDKDILKILKPNFLSVSYKYGLYHIIAENIVQKKNYSLISNPISNFFDANKNPLVIGAKLGNLYDDNKKLTLFDNVLFEYKDIKLTTDKSYIDLVEHICHTNDYAKVIQDESFINSPKGFKSFIKQKKITFFGPINGLYHDKVKNTYTKVHSKTLEIDDIKHHATFKEKVIIEQQDLIVNAEIVIYKYIDKKEIYLEQNLVFNTKDQIIKGNRGIVDLENNTLTIYDNISIYKGNNILKGDKFVYSFDTKKGKVFSSNTKKVRANILETK